MGQYFTWSPPSHQGIDHPNWESYMQGFLYNVHFSHPVEVCIEAVQKYGCKELPGLYYGRMNWYNPRSNTGHLTKYYPTVEELTLREQLIKISRSRNTI